MGVTGLVPSTPDVPLDPAWEVVHLEGSSEKEGASQVTRREVKRETVRALDSNLKIFTHIFSVPLTHWESMQLTLLMPNQGRGEFDVISVHGYKFRVICVPKLALLSSLSEASSISRRFGIEARIIYSTFQQKPKVNAGLKIFLL